MRQVDKEHINYHLNQLLGHCDNRIADIRLYWDSDALVGATIWYDQGFRRDVTTKNMRLAEAFEMIMDAI